MQHEIKIHRLDASSNPTCLVSFHKFNFQNVIQICIIYGLFNQVLILQIILRLNINYLLHTRLQDYNSDKIVHPGIKNQFLLSGG